jgi:hypothetical protein
MKQIYFFIILAAVVLTSSCKSSKYSTKADEKDLAMLIKRLNKRGANTDIVADLRDVYSKAYQRGTDRLNRYRYEPAPGKWEKLIPEMQALQRMYETISQSAYALRELRPVNFAADIRNAKDSAANDFYNYALQYENSSERSGLKEAYYAFNKSAGYVANYKDSRTKMRTVFDAATVNVLVNPIQYDAFGMSGWSWNNYNNRSQWQQQQMIRDLGGPNAGNIPARFFSEWDLRRENTAPDLVVDFVWRNIRFDQPLDRTRTYNRSKQIEVGKDTANRPVYQTVNATVFVTERQFNADADLQIVITDAASRRQQKWEQVPSNFRHSVEYAEYNGDRRALDQNDWTLINRNRNQQMPTNEDAFEEMMRRIYNDVVNRVRRAVDW